MLLNNREPAVVVDRGPLLENVRISPEMCSLWLKFVAPLVADATRAEGKFSLSLEGAERADRRRRWPATSPARWRSKRPRSARARSPSNILGMAQADSLVLRAGAGAAAGDDTNRGWLVMPQQDVQFEVREGAVHHRGLKMTVGDMVITTEGSVGIETQQINLVTSIPVQESWLKNRTGMFAALKGQTIKIPSPARSRSRGSIRGPAGPGQAAGRRGRARGGGQASRARTALLNKEVERGQGLIPEGAGRGTQPAVRTGRRRRQQPQPLRGKRCKEQDPEPNTNKAINCFLGSWFFGSWNFISAPPTDRDATPFARTSGRRRWRACCG